MIKTGHSIKNESSEEDYTYKKFKVPGINTDFSITICHDNYRVKRLANSKTVKSIHPYDNQEYHSAISYKDGEWNLCRNSKILKKFSAKSEQEVAKIIYKADKDAGLTSRIDKS